MITKKPKFYKGVSGLLISILFLLMILFPEAVETQTPYIDIGLRVYDGTETVFIATEPTGTLTSPLRIAKGGTTYGIVLVDPLDFFASKVRILTSSGIKALAVLYIKADALCLIGERIVRSAPGDPDNMLSILALPIGISKDEIDDEMLVLYVDGYSTGIPASAESRHETGARVKILSFFNKSEILALVPGRGQFQVRVVGRLKSGQYFYGEGTILIVPR